MPQPIQEQVSRAMVGHAPLGHEWHSILGHIGHWRLKILTALVDGLDVIDLKSLENHQCTACMEFGAKRAQIPAPKPRPTHPVELTHTDI